MTFLEPFWGSPAAGFVVAFAVGLLIGVERERRKTDPSVGSAGGLRTHVIVALAGALAVQFPGVWIVVAIDVCSVSTMTGEAVQFAAINVAGATQCMMCRRPRSKEAT